MFECSFLTNREIEKIGSSLFDRLESFSGIDDLSDVKIKHYEAQNQNKMTKGEE